jgi:exodeoxyribonuclease III
VRVITLNVNGIRSAETKGLSTWLREVDADVVCLQEIKANIDDIPASLRQLPGYHASFYPAEKKGYSGVALYSKTAPKQVRLGFDGGEFDAEGRVLQADFGKLSLISAYFPSGSSGPDRQEAKFRFLAKIAPHLRALKASGQSVILCGDINIAHQNIDLKNWKSNQKNSGFTPEERAWLTELFAEGWVDVQRGLYPDTELYTWWSARGAAYSNNVGWRIDYQIATGAVASTAASAYVYKDQKFSDHAPLVVDYTHETV